MNKKKSDIFGTNKHIFIEEIEPYRYFRDKTCKSKIKVRRALFECGLCSKEFEAQITAVKNSRTLSCGCYRDERSREFLKKLRSEK